MTSYFQFASLLNKTFPKGILQEHNLSFKSKLSLKKEGKNENGRVDSPDSVPNHLNLKQKSFEFAVYVANFLNLRL